MHLRFVRVKAVSSDTGGIPLKEDQISEECILGNTPHAKHTWGSNDDEVGLSTQTLSISNFMHVGLHFGVPIFLTQSVCQHSIISLLEIVPSHCLQTSSADTAPTGMSDKDKADFYHLQAVQAKQNLQEACVLYMSKVQQN